ncbi:MAG TPA: rod shape-determining protein MreC [Tepidisphaeraceae bacterium]|nr:rod shape-determining protein MreC [Tepidisphaeraceae bacterium]
MRFNQVYVGLLLLSVCSAFFIPARYTDPIRGVQKLFAPVSIPARKIGSVVRHRVAPEGERDRRAVEDVKAENDRLRAENLSLMGQLVEMRQINQERAQLGDMRPLCTPFRVVGTDPGVTRDSLAIAASNGDGVEPQMPVLYANGIVGRIARVGVSGAQVQLVTDPRFQAAAKFYRSAGGKLVEVQGASPRIVRGTGSGAMFVENLPLSEVQSKDQPDKGVAVADYVVLNDPDWPMQLTNQVLGRIESIRPSPRVAMFAEVQVRPVRNLAELREVMVMNKPSG